MDHQCHGEIDAGVVVIEIDAAQLRDGLDAVDQGVAVDEKPPGGVGNIAVFRQIDADRMDIVCAAVPILVQQYLESLVFQSKGAVVLIEKAEHFNKGIVVKGAYTALGFDAA